MDWSYAGYRAGEVELPDLQPTIDVKADHGAVGDGVVDDTDALEAALSAAGPGDVVHLPAGTYRLTDQLEIPSGVVLQGAGMDATTLDIPISLTDLKGNPGLDGGGTSSYSFGSGFIEASGGSNGSELATVTAPALRGATTVTLSSTDGVAAGEWIRIDQTDVGGDLMDRLHADLQQGGSDNVGDKGMSFHTRVVAVGSNDVQIERALPVDIDLAWSPTVYVLSRTAEEVGLEHLTIQFPETSYPGHFDELGYNAVHYRGMFNSWVRNVRVLNADYGINFSDSFFCTADGVVIDAANDRSGHHALNNGHGGDNLFVGFELGVSFVHDVTVEWYATGVVVTKGYGVALSMDHHRAAPYTTLWTELNLGSGSRAWVSGGAGNRGPHTAAYDTLWNVQADNDLAFPDDDYGPRMNFVGFQTSETPTSSLDWWFEDIDPSELDPPNLWEAMRERRMPTASGGTGGIDGTGGTGGSGGTQGAGATGSASGGTASVGAGGTGGAGPPEEPAKGEGSSEAGSGCACRATGSLPPRSSSMLLLFVVLGGAVLRRRATCTRHRDAISLS
jgi:hypothetical protein